MQSGIGLTLRLEKLTYDNILETSLELLNNKKYKENVQRLSRKMKSEPVDSLTKTLNCIEHFLLHNKACVAPSKNNEVSLFEFLYLDLILAFILSIAFSAVTFIYLSKQIYKFFTEFLLKELVKIQKKIT